MPAINASRALVLVAFVIFVLATFGVGFGAVNMVALGLAFWAASAVVT